MRVLRIISERTRICSITYMSEKCADVKRSSNTMTVTNQEEGVAVVLEAVIAAKAAKLAATAT